MKKKVHAQPPEKLTGIQLRKIPDSAVGAKAIQSALSHMKDEVGLTADIANLLALGFLLVLASEWVAGLTPGIPSVLWLPGILRY